MGEQQRPALASEEGMSHKTVCRVVRPVEQMPKHLLLEALTKYCGSLEGGLILWV
jgi:hypothetical protein